MRDTDIPVKTEAGHRELGQRQHKLHARARSILIAIHGELHVAELRAQFRALGDVDAILRELADAGLITTAVDAAAATGSTAAEPVGARIPAAQIAKQFMNESAVAAIGPWPSALMFTLKLEHCYTADELRGLLPEYQRVVGKAKGAEFAEAMAQRAEALLVAG